MAELSIIMPCYNEEKYLKEIVEKIKALNLENIELIIVDDGSKDGLLNISKNLAAQNNWVKIVSYPENRGKGFAIREGFKNSAGKIIIIQDADLEYDPNDIPRVIALIKEKKAEVVYGSRFLKNNWPQKMQLKHWLANKILIYFTRFLFNTKITDEATCYKAFERETFENLNFSSCRFEFCCEATAKILKKKIKIYEVPISYEARSLKGGKKIRLKDFYLSLWTLLKYRFQN